MDNELNSCEMTLQADANNNTYFLDAAIKSIKTSLGVDGINIKISDEIGETVKKIIMITSKSKISFEEAVQCSNSIVSTIMVNGSINKAVALYKSVIKKVVINGSVDFENHLPNPA